MISRSFLPGRGRLFRNRGHRTYLRGPLQDFSRSSLSLTLSCYARSLQAVLAESVAAAAVETEVKVSLRRLRGLSS